MATTKERDDVKVMDAPLPAPTVTRGISPEPSRFERIGMLVVKIQGSEDDYANVTSCLADMRDWIDAASKTLASGGKYEIPPVPASVRKIVDLSPLAAAIEKANSGQSELADMREQLKGLTASR